MPIKEVSNFATRVFTLVYINYMFVEHFPKIQTTGIEFYEDGKEKPKLNVKFK